MHIGIIGLGRLGSALARGLSRSSTAATTTDASTIPDIVLGFNRTLAKARALADHLPGLQICDSAAEVLARCELVFLWTNGADARTVLDQNAATIRARQPLVVSCTLDVPLADFTPRWAECLPNVAMPTGHAVTPISFGPTLSPDDRTLLHAVLGRVGSVYEVRPQDLTYFSALSSCGPALYARLLEMMADTLSEQRGFDRDLCRRMVRQTVQGTIHLQELDGIDASEVTHRVAHPGGSTDAGLRHLQAVMPRVFQEMRKSMRKWD